MKTAIETALELIDKYSLLVPIEFGGMNKELAEECALICVNEIITQWEYIDTYLGDGNGELNPNLRYWQQVKQEIEKL